MPKCVLLPIPKSGKTYLSVIVIGPFHLLLNLSKVLEHIILAKCSQYLVSNQLQFGFKSGSSTSLCIALVKNIVSWYVFNSSSVYGCFLDASKAFDLVDMGVLYADQGRFHSYHPYVERLPTL